MDAKDYKAFVVQRDFSIQVIERFVKERGVRSGARSRKGELYMKKIMRSDPVKKK